MPSQQALPINERDTVRDVAARGEAITITVRDVVRHRDHDLPGGEHMLRVPYDLFHPIGPVRFERGFITYLQDGELRNGQVAEAELSDAHPGERVLLRLPDERGIIDANEWWLCEIEAVDGVDED
jgi:hypothetical protein